MVHPIDPASKSRAEINRANAQKSTGPKTEAGKQRSSLNAYRHGFSAQIVILPEAEYDAYKRFIQTFHDDFQPLGAMELQLVQTIAEKSWKVNRCDAWENQILALDFGAHPTGLALENNPQLHGALSLAAVVRHETRELVNLSLYQQRNYRQLQQSLKQLRELQAERVEREENELPHAARLLQMHEDEQAAAAKTAPATHAPRSYQPSQDGFVYSLPHIRAFILRRQRRNQAFEHASHRTAAA